MESSYYFILFIFYAFYNFIFPIGNGLIFVNNKKFWFIISPSSNHQQRSTIQKGPNWWNLIKRNGHPTNKKEDGCEHLWRFLVWKINDVLFKDIFLLQIFCVCPIKVKLECNSLLPAYSPGCDKLQKIQILNVKSNIFINKFVKKNLKRFVGTFCLTK